MKRKNLDRDQRVWEEINMSYYFLLDLALILLSTKILGLIAQKFQMPQVVGALIAGLLGMQPDDLRIPGSFAIAAEQGLTFAFQNVQLRNAHPNTARLQLTDAKGRTLDIVAESVGGGRIRIRSIDGIETNFSGEHNTLIVHNQDTPGHVAAVTAALMQRHVNIATMQLYRSEQGGYAVMILECDQPIPKDIEQWLSHIEGIQKITIFNQEEPV